jgi:hypothetical protein
LTGLDLTGLDLVPSPNMSRNQVEAVQKAFGETLLGAGLDLLKSKAGDQHPAGPPQHGTLGQAERAFSAASTFLSGVLA